jgi:hypothetical protein
MVSLPSSNWHGKMREGRGEEERRGEERRGCRVPLEEGER